MVVIPDATSVLQVPTVLGVAMSDKEADPV